MPGPGTWVTAATTQGPNHQTIAACHRGGEWSDS